MPSSGASGSSTAPCANPIVVAPSTLPRTIAQRGVGEASTDSRNPSRRSSISEMFEKIEAKSTTSATTPYSSRSGSPGSS